MAKSEEWAMSGNGSYPKEGIDIKHAELF